VKKFVLLGHSLGGYLATAYTIRYPQRVSHLVLVDPWGFSEPPKEEEVMEMFSPFQRLSWRVLSHIRPFSAVRAAGPWGEGVGGRGHLLHKQTSRENLKGIPVCPS
jgi:pimeloyl-ACP methyl ester carboxylesterase